MNTKHSIWNRLFAALLLAVMLVTQTTTAFVQSSMETSFLNCTFSNCMAEAVEVKNGYQYFETCTFENNTAQYGPHIRFDGGSGYVLDCSFTGGTATIRGGAIAS